jgi:hypothetical protein
VVTLQGDTLCGPCKNFRLRGVHRPSPIAPLAIISVIVGLISAPFGFCLSLAGVQFQVAAGRSGSAFLMGVIALVLPVAALVLGHFALRQIESKANVGGRLFAMTGTAAGLVGTVWSGTVAMILILKSF